MSGMVTTVNTSISEAGSRMMTIEVTGVCRQEVARTSNYTVKVPYSRMSQTIQNINRMGGKVANISLGGVAAPTSGKEPANQAQAEQAPETKAPARRKNRKGKGK